MLFSHIHTMHTSPAVPLLITHICNSTYLGLHTCLPSRTNFHCTNTVQQINRKKKCSVLLGRGHEEHWANWPKPTLGLCALLSLSLLLSLPHTQQANGKCEWHQRTQRHRYTNIEPCFSMAVALQSINTSSYLSLRALTLVRSLSLVQGQLLFSCVYLACLFCMHCLWLWVSAYVKCQAVSHSALPVRVQCLHL